MEAKESGNFEDLVRSDSYAKAVEAEDSGNLEVLVRSDSYAEAERDVVIRSTSEDGTVPTGLVKAHTAPHAVSVTGTLHPDFLRTTCETSGALLGNRLAAQLASRLAIPIATTTSATNTLL